MKHRRIISQIKLKTDEQEKKFFFKFFKAIQKIHSIFYRFRINNANSLHDSLRNLMFNQLNRCKRELSNNDNFEKEIFVSSFRKFKRQIFIDTFCVNYHTINEMFKLKNSKFNS